MAIPHHGSVVPHCMPPWGRKESCGELARGDDSVVMVVCKKGTRWKLAPAWSIGRAHRNTQDPLGGSKALRRGFRSSDGALRVNVGVEEEDSSLPEHLVTHRPLCHWGSECDWHGRRSTRCSHNCCSVLL